MGAHRLPSLACLTALAWISAFAGCGSGGGKPGAPHGGHREGAPAVAQATRVEIPAGSGHLAAMAPAQGLTLRAKPNGKVIAHLRQKTIYGSPTVVWATARRGNWLAVVATALHNNRIGWLNVQHDRPRMWRTRFSIEARLSQRTLVLRRGSKVIKTVPVTIGSPATPTPTGRFEVTDKLIPRAGTGYGCCILALSGHQPYLRPGWAGGDRIAIHGSSDQSTGAAASAGCLRARDSDLRALMKVVKLGTPVVIRA